MRGFYSLSLAFLIGFAGMQTSYADNGEKLAMNQPQQIRTQSYADSPQAQAQPDITVPVAAIAIIKSQRVMYLLDSQNHILRSYKVALGPDPNGPKVKEGDGKTPEGTYKVDFRNENSEYYRSIRISYPNADDVARAKRAGITNTGGNIYIHGTPPAKSWMFWHYSNLRDWTLGCIGLSNKDMTEVWNLVRQGTPVKINP